MRGGIEMKIILKKSIILLLIFIISTTFIYLALTFKLFYEWGNKNCLFISGDSIEDLDSERIEQIGNKVGTYAKMLEESLKEVPEDENVYSIAEYYNPLGFSVWSFMHRDVYLILKTHTQISVILGIVISIAYIIITSKKINNILKIIIGYISVILIVPQILFYLYNGRLFSLLLPYYKTHGIEYFYIIYTAIFLLMYVINYKLGQRMAKELNETIGKYKN